jgi:hypothetical protein
MFLISYGSNREVASFTGVCTVLNEGILYCKALSKVVCPVETRSFADTTSIGKGLWYYFLPVFLILLLQFPVMLPPSSDKTTFIIECCCFSTLEKPM